MPRIATKDTYGTERTGDVEIRRLVKAGQPIPASIEVADGDFTDTDKAEVVTGKANVMDRLPGGISQEGGEPTVTEESVQEPGTAHEVRRERAKAQESGGSRRSRAKDE